ncbi:MAG: hypothetical protein IPK16_23095 [Anaerolineales bacterium]|nr:hypothetical protein [Anaerolineales bacterium]
METGPGDNGDFVSGVLAFRVAAYDPSAGSSDGAGIDFVLMWVYGPDGQLVREHREGTAGYCVFQGGEPDCNLWDFAANGYIWPDGANFTPGPHRLVAEVHADDGRVVPLERVVQIQ